MSNVVLTPTLGPVSGFPAGSAVAALLIVGVANTAANSPPSQTVPPGATSVTFQNLAADTYAFSATPVDANGNALTAPGYSVPSVNVVVPVAQSVTLTVPTSLSASVT
jgi:hypothetical protein